MCNDIFACKRRPKAVTVHCLKDVSTIGIKNSRKTPKDPYFSLYHIHVSSSNLLLRKQAVSVSMKLLLLNRILVFIFNMNIYILELWKKEI